MKVVVTTEWLKQIIPFYADNCFCPDAIDEAIARGDNLCKGECLECWMEYGDGAISPLEEVTK